MTITWILLGSCVAITAMAAVTDYRTGRIPNWLTLPPLVVGPLLHFVSGGPTGLLGALVAIAVCGLVPYLMFRCGAIGGGDVKLFAAMGALCGAFVGLEAQFMSYLLAAVFALGVLTWRGKLLTTLGNALFVGLNPVLPRRWRRDLQPQLLTSIRMGAAIFAGTIFVVLLRVPVLGI